MAKIMNYIVSICCHFAKIYQRITITTSICNVRSLLRQLMTQKLCHLLSSNLLESYIYNIMNENFIRQRNTRVIYW